MIRMTRIAAALAGLGAAAIAFAADAPPAQAYVWYPWCAHYGGREGGAPSCGFNTWEQCMATVSGTQGTCEMNPWPPPAAPPRVRRQRG